MTEWETFCDECYYHMWRVRRKGERHFDDGFHVNNRDEANALVELLNELERERDEAQAALDEIEEYGTEEINAAVDLRRQLAAALIERDEAREQLAAERALVDRLAGILDLYYADDTIAHQAGIADAIEAWKEARNDQTSRS